MVFGGMNTVFLYYVNILRFFFYLLVLPTIYLHKKYEVDININVIVSLLSTNKYYSVKTICYHY